jgi:hypothetical protein
MFSTYFGIRGTSSVAETLKKWDLPYFMSFIECIYFCTRNVIGVICFMKSSPSKTRVQFPTSS